MPQSLTKLYAHLIFSTKNRQPFLDDEIRERVHAYLATVFRDLGSPYVVVGGVADHVHILFDMGKVRAPAKFVEQAKRESSKFIKRSEMPTKISIGNAVMECFLSARRAGKTLRNTCETKTTPKDDVSRRVPDVLETLQSGI